MMIGKGDLFRDKQGRLGKVVHVFSDNSFYYTTTLDEDINNIKIDGDGFVVYPKSEWIDGENVKQFSIYTPATSLGYAPTDKTDTKYEGQAGAIGMKYDNGKLQAGILFEDFPRALKEVMKIATYGAKKYSRNSWITVPSASERYHDAMIRHQIEIGIHGRDSLDEESGLMHLAHFTWNALAILELELREQQGIKNGTNQTSF